LRSASPRREHFWVHVDADVLDDAVMPAVDYRQPGGLSPDELATVLAVALATGHVARRASNPADLQRLLA
jgi:arginase